MAEKAIHTVGVAGLGLLGRGIAACLLAHDFRVIAYTDPPAGFGPAREHIQAALKDLVDHGVAPRSLSTDWASRYVEVRAPSAFAMCDFVIESIVEDLEAKRHLFDDIEMFVGERVPIASNTSSLPVTLLQEGRRHPERFIGMHWAEPCYITRFLEVIRGEQTDDATVATTLALSQATGKDPSLVQKDVEGFLVNRLGYAMYREAFHLLESGVADVETIDRSVRNALGLWAAVAGPFRWMDLTGLAGYARVMGRIFPQLSNAKDVPQTMRQLVASGATGVANGRGFYQYTPDEARNWEARLLDNVWTVRALHERHFPIGRSAAKRGPTAAQPSIKRNHETDH